MEGGREGEREGGREGASEGASDGPGRRWTGQQPSLNDSSTSICPTNNGAVTSPVGPSIYPSICVSMYLFIRLAMHAFVNVCVAINAFRCFTTLSTELMMYDASV